ncbi:hypothetical protein PAPYR_5939 [Paratrimastix pyriformis]|uniref:F-box domain-containing protein n=1 Tax=Paratrimastix pyriformis TaxID=342808 RepID=A0ABQ8UGK3_9EUKA|nr:hypothetical protein PAPYR_5939 [Paratrimastix pyriformis]
MLFRLPREILSNVLSLFLADCSRDDLASLLLTCKDILPVCRTGIDWNAVSLRRWGVPIFKGFEYYGRLGLHLEPSEWSPFTVFSNHLSLEDFQTKLPPEFPTHPAQKAQLMGPDAERNLIIRNTLVVHTIYDSDHDNNGGFGVEASTDTLFCVYLPSGICLFVSVDYDMNDDRSIAGLQEELFVKFALAPGVLPSPDPEHYRECPMEPRPYEPIMQELSPLVWGTSTPPPNTITPEWMAEWLSAVYNRADQEGLVDKKDKWRFSANAEDNLGQEDEDEEIEFVFEGEEGGEEDIPAGIAPGGED